MSPVLSLSKMCWCAEKVSACVRVQKLSKGRAAIVKPAERAHRDETLGGEPLLDDLLGQTVLVHAIVRRVKDGPRRACRLVPCGRIRAGCCVKRDRSVRGGCPTWTCDGGGSASEPYQALIRSKPDRSDCLVRLRGGRFAAVARLDDPGCSPSRRFEVIPFEALLGEDMVDRTRPVRMTRLLGRDPGRLVLIREACRLGCGAPPRVRRRRRRRRRRRCSRHGSAATRPELRCDLLFRAGVLSAKLS